MTSVNGSCMTFLLVGLFMLTACAVGDRKPRLNLSSQVQSRPVEASGAVTVDDARLRAELAAAAGRAAGVTPVPDFRRRFCVARTSDAPAIDGRLDDDVWAKATVLKDFTVAQSFNDKRLPSPAADATEARVLFDEKGLYVAVRAFQDPKTIYTTVKANGWLRPDLDWEQWSEQWANTGCDEIEIAIDPELTMASYYVFHVNPDGVRRKHYMPPVPTGSGSFKRVDPILIADDNWRAAATRDEKGWCAELFIPFESIGFRPISQVPQRDVYFDMVQDHTVMGLNVNRISHQRHEPSSWSPSKGAMFFRDVENFGLAHFAPSPASIEKLSFGEISRDENKVSFAVRSRSDKTESLSLRLLVTGLGLSREETQSLSLAPETSKDIEMAFTPAPAGVQKVELGLLAADGAVADRARYCFEIPAPVETTLTKTVLYEGESDLPVTVRTSVAADEMRCSIMSSGKKVVSLKAPSQGVSRSVLPFEVAFLPKGDYEFCVELLGSGKVYASARQPFRVIADPWSARISGKAGSGPRPKGVPAGFAALASAMPGDSQPVSFSGTVPYLDDAMQAKGYLLYAETATADFTSGGSRGRRRRSAVPSSAYPRKAQLSAPIRAFAAGDEYEAISFAVFALKNLKNPRVEFTDLKSASGAVIPSDQMDLRAERQDTYLVKQDSLGDIPAMTGRRYFLTVYVAPGTKAGIYSGAITFSAEGRPVEERKISLLVLPFKLPEAPAVNGIYGGLHGSRDTDRDMVVAADLLAHGMDNPTCVSVFLDPSKVNVHHLIWDLELPTEENWLGDSPERFNAEIDEGVFRNIRESVLRGPFVIEVNYLLRYLPCTEENAQGFQSALRRIEALRLKYGLDEFTYHLVDEPNNHYTYDDGRYGRRYGIERVKFFGKALHELGLRSYVSMNSAGRGYDIGEAVYDELDIWCANFISDEKQVDRWTTGGREVWLYNYAGDGWCKGAMRSTYGFYSLRVRAKGVTIWHHPSYVGWNDDEKKVVARASWDAAREGVDDCRYAALLTSLIEKARKAGGAKARLAARAQEDLDAIVGAYPVPTPDKAAFESLHDASDWNKWRWIIAQWILRLT